MPEGGEWYMVMCVTSYDEIERALAGREGTITNAERGVRAAVALILREGAAGLEILFIERAMHEGDPWSGDLCFPGGKVEADDADPRFTAERETKEEIGLDLGGARHLGRLAEITGATLPVRVTCFVYGVVDGVELRPNSEVQDAFWVPIAELADPERHVEAPVRFREGTSLQPAIRLEQPGKPVLWGLTYRLLMEFLELCRRPGNSGRLPVPKP